jgi:potassium efflux system protein
VLAAFGYYETAAQVQGRLFTTAWVSLVGLIVYSFAMRWVVVAHRRLAVAQARQKRDKAIALAAAKQAAEASGEVVSQALELPEIDLSSVSHQTRTLLRWIVGGTVLILLWLVWSELVPALGVLDNITMWTHLVATDQGEQLMPVTLWAVLLFILIFVLTVIATRNVPGVLEITVLQRLSLDAGTRYAIGAVSRYLIIAVGIVVAFAQIGADWSKMQWIVAALGVGLGFGLQEIVANFVSGLIILFEQPIRVGDLVTVGDQIGTVSRIHIRATTIIDPDNREIIIPNKAIITDRVTNWALSDPVTRLVVKVGIAYGSDTALAHRVLLETVKANPLVLDSPPPTVFFLGFGDSSLNFEVRVYVREILNRIPLLHELHMAIDRALREHKIEIPFPQRDLHLRTVAAAIEVQQPRQD